MIVATVYGNGPYRPVVLYRKQAFQVGQAMEDMGEAIAVACDVAAAIRDDLRSPRFEELLARL